MKFGIRNKKPKDENIHSKIPEENEEYFTIPPSRTTNNDEKSYSKKKIPTDTGTIDIKDRKEAFESLSPPRVDEKIPQDKEPPSRYGSTPKEEQKGNSRAFQLPPKLQSKKPDSKSPKERPTNYGVVEDKKERKNDISNKPLPKHIHIKDPESFVDKRPPASYGSLENKKENKNNSNRSLPKTTPIVSKHPDSPPTDKGTILDKKDKKTLNNKIPPKEIKSKHPSHTLPASSGFNENKKENKDNSNRLIPKTIVSKHPGSLPTNKGSSGEKKYTTFIHNKFLPRKIKSKHPSQLPPPSYSLSKNKNEKKGNTVVTKSISSKYPKDYPSNKGIGKLKNNKKNILSKNISRTIVTKKPNKRSSPPPVFENSIPKTQIHEKKPNN